ncbi:MAG: nucleoside 2-deoxyribosyltransferase domain-containing protein [Bacillaceae bacterium]
MKKVFLGGTCANSKWRDRLIPMLKIDYFNPVVKKWTPECQKEELKQREICDFVLYTLTRVYSAYSIAEVVDDSHKRPEKTIVCVINEDYQGKEVLSKRDLKGLDAVARLVERNGGKYFKSLSEVAEYLNKHR